MGIEPTRSAWKAEVLPLNYIRIHLTLYIISPNTCIVKKNFQIPPNYIFIISSCFCSGKGWVQDRNRGDAQNIVSNNFAP